MDYPIKVLILDTVMDRGGAEAMTMNYLRNLNREKIQFDFLVHRDYKAAYEDEIAELGGRIYRICPPYPQNWFRYQKTIRRLFHEHPEYQIIHCNMMELGFPAYVAAKYCGVPVRICHAHITSAKKITSISQFVWKCVRKCYRIGMIPNITHKFACGTDAGKYLYGDCEKQIVYMKNAIDVSAYQFDAKVREEMRNRLSLNGKFVIGHIGRFFEQKNHSFLIDMFYDLSKTVENAVLILVGGGEVDDRNITRIKQKVDALGLSDKVIFTGVRSDVNLFYQAFDVFVLPSLFEGFPVVMMEAQAAGLPCIVSDTVTRECAVTTNVSYLPIDCGTAQWVDRIASLKETMINRDTSQQIVDAGYDIRQNAVWLERFYIDALDGRNK